MLQVLNAVAENETVIYLFSQTSVLMWLEKSCCYLEKLNFD